MQNENENGNGSVMGYSVQRREIVHKRKNICVITREKASPIVNNRESWIFHNKI